MTRVLIVIEGGNVQAVLADGPVEVSIKDWDNIKSGDHYNPMRFEPVEPIATRKLAAAAFEGLK